MEYIKKHLTLIIVVLVLLALVVLAYVSHLQEQTAITAKDTTNKLADAQRVQAEIADANKTITADELSKKIIAALNAENNKTLSVTL